MLVDRHGGRPRGSVSQPDFVLAPSEDAARAASRRAGVPVVVLSEIGPPGEH
jgi:hypothetical protein